VIGVAAKVLAGFAPLLSQAFEGGRHDQHHERELKIHVDDAQAPEVIDGEALGMNVHFEYGLDDAGDQARIAHGGDEGKGQRNAGEVRRHAGETYEEGARPLGQPAQDHRVGEQEAEQGAAQCSEQADLQAELVGIANILLLEEIGDILEREDASRALETTDKDGDRRQQQEQDGKDKERCHADPGP
jgi:hypothetical protein